MFLFDDGNENGPVPVLWTPCDIDYDDTDIINAVLIYPILDNCIKYVKKINIDGRIAPWNGIDLPLTSEGRYAEYENGKWYSRIIPDLTMSRILQNIINKNTFQILQKDQELIEVTWIRSVLHNNRNVLVYVDELYRGKLYQVFDLITKPWSPKGTDCTTCETSSRTSFGSCTTNFKKKHPNNFWVCDKIDQVDITNKISQIQIIQHPNKYDIQVRWVPIHNKNNCYSLVYANKENEGKIVHDKNIESLLIIPLGYKYQYIKQIFDCEDSYILITNLIDSESDSE